MNFLSLHFVSALMSVGITNVFLAIFILCKGGWKEKLYRIFALYSFSIAWWSFSQIGLIISKKVSDALFWARIEEIGVLFIPTTFVHFIITLLDLKNKKWLLKTSYLLSIFFVLFSFSPYVIRNAKPKFFVRYWSEPGFLYHLSVLFFLSLTLYGLYKLIRAYITSTGVRHKQLFYLCIGSILGYGGGLANFLLSYNIYIPILNPFGTYLVAIYAIITAYAIVRYRLMDIDLVLTRVTIFIIVSLFILSLPFWSGIKLHLNLFTFTSFLGGIIALFTGLLVFLKNNKAIVNRCWLLLSLSVAIWSSGYSFMLYASNKSYALLWRLFMDGGAILIPAFHLHFILALIGNIKRYKKQLAICYVTTLVIFCLNYTDLFIKDVIPKAIFYYYPEPKIGYYLFALNFIFWAGIAIYRLLQEFVKSKGFVRRQLEYMFLASFVGFGGGSTAFLLTFNINILPYGMLLFFLYPLIVTYAIIRHRLMDINLALTRAGIFIIVYTLVLGLPFWFGFATGKWILTTTMMAILATGGPFIYLFIQHRAEKVLFREQHRYQDTLRHSSMGMTRIRDLKKLVNLIVHIVTKTVKITHASVFLLDSKTNQYHLQASRDRGRTKQDVTFNENSPLILYLKLERRPLVNEEIKQNIEQNTSLQAQELRLEMEKLSASVIIPSFIEDKLIGFLVLGEKVSGKIYTSDDLIVFSVLANQAALAIENAMFFKESKEFQGRIAQAEKMATIGTMANGLSHQINNRLHAISMITGDTYDLLKYIDTTTCSDGVKESLEQIKHALERTKENIRLGREIVQGILKYSRPNQEGLEMLSLDTIFDNAINMAQYKVKLDEFDFDRNYAKDLPKIKGNLGQLQEVFFNMIDNAFYAISERKEFLKEEGYRGKISVSAELHDKFVRIKVQDNGIGVKGEDFLKLFTPFFTTKASSKGGSGLGLYVIKQIVEQNHKGKINMESTYKEGTTFFIELPIA